MDDDAIDAVQVIEKLSQQIANQAKHIAYLEVLIVSLRDQNELLYNEMNPPTDC